MKSALPPRSDRAGRIASVHARSLTKLASSRMHRSSPSPRRLSGSSADRTCTEPPPGIVTIRSVCLTSAPGIEPPILDRGRHPTAPILYDGVNHHALLPAAAVSRHSHTPNLVFPQRLPPLRTLNRAGWSCTSLCPACGLALRVTITWLVLALL